MYRLRGVMGWPLETGGSFRTAPYIGFWGFGEFRRSGAILADGWRMVVGWLLVGWRSANLRSIRKVIQAMAAVGFSKMFRV